MSKKKKTAPRGGENIRLDPEKRVAPQFDGVGSKKFLAPEPSEMGFRVLDDCAEDHEM